jgi:hypothetical protein
MTCTSTRASTGSPAPRRALALDPGRRLRAEPGDLRREELPELALRGHYPKKTKDSGTLNPSGGWSPSPVLKLDDVYIDPRFHR